MSDANPTFRVKFSGEMFFYCDTEEEARKEFKEACEFIKSDCSSIDWVDDLREEDEAL